jgi:hypothetical protein
MILVILVQRCQMAVATSDTEIALLLFTQKLHCFFYRLPTLAFFSPFSAFLILFLCSSAFWLCTKSRESDLGRASLALGSNTTLCALEHYFPRPFKGILQLDVEVLCPTAACLMVSCHHLVDRYNHLLRTLLKENNSRRMIDFPLVLSCQTAASFSPACDRKMLIHSSIKISRDGFFFYTPTLLSWPTSGIPSRLNISYVSVLFLVGRKSTH